MQRGNPQFRFRLPRAEQETLREMARVYGSESASGFVRELVRAAVTGPEKAGAFVQRLLEKQGEQLALNLTARAAEKAKAGCRRRRARRV
jgi:hypothetical protein